MSICCESVRIVLSARVWLQEDDCMAAVAASEFCDQLLVALTSLEVMSIVI